MRAARNLLSCVRGRRVSVGSSIGSRCTGTGSYKKRRETDEVLRLASCRCIFFPVRIILGNCAATVSLDWAVRLDSILTLFSRTAMLREIGALRVSL